MKCFNHQADAVGTCKNCSKGLCKDCAVEVGKGLACRNSCEEFVDSINKMIDKSKEICANTSRAYSKQAFIFGFLGSCFMSFGILSQGLVAALLIPIGIIFLISTAFLASNARKVK